MTELSPPEAIFFAALERATAAERAAFLDDACAGDGDLRRRVERLLAAQPRLGGFLERPVVEAADLAALAPPESPAKGTESVRSEEPPQRARNGEALDYLATSHRPGSLGRLGHYEVLEVVGKGGMGVVLRAFDDKLHRVVAIKALAAQLTTSGSARQRFVREAQAAAAVTHDNVIDIHAVEDTGPVPYLVMQFIDGRTLQEKLDRSGPLSVKEILRIGLQIAAGLAAAHAQGLIHRDVKPANILLENGVERVKITDFGLARALDEASITQSGIIAGTPTYMSPEQANGEHVDHRSDLFSLGSVLYTLCAGHAPFRADTTMAVLKRVSEDTPRPIREVNPEVPDWLAAIIAKLHAKSPAERFASAAEVAQLLSRHLAQLQQVGIRPSEPSTFLAEPRTQRSGGSGWSGKAASSARILAACAVLIAVGGGALYWIFWRPDEAKMPNGANGTPQEPPPRKPQLVPASEELARRPAPADALRREDIPPDLLEKAGGGDRAKAPPQLVAVFGEDRHAAGDGRNHLNTVVFSPDGKTLAFGGIDKAVRLIRLEGKPGQEQTWNQRPPECNVECLAFSPDSKVLACGKGNGAILLWNVATGAELRPLPSPDHVVTQIAFSPDGTLLASAGENGGAVVRLWEVASGQLLFTSHMPETGRAWCAAFSPDGKTLAAGLETGEVRLWDLATKGEVASLAGHGGRVRWLGFHPDGRSLVVAGSFADNLVYVYDVASRTLRHLLSGHGSEVLSAAWRADGGLLVTAGATDGTVRLWDLSGDRPRSRALPVIPPDVPWLHGIALSPEGRHLAVCNPNGTLYVLRLAKRGEVYKVPADPEK
jgi:serine/threonine protein kinase